MEWIDQEEDGHTVAPWVTNNNKAVALVLILVVNLPEGQ